MAKTPTKKTPKKVTTKVVKKTPADKLKPAEIRFVHLILGAEGAVAWNNATKAYAIAYEKDLDDKSQYGTCKTNGNRLLTNADILAYRNWLLTEAGYDEKAIKKRFAEIAFQDENLGVALSATRDMAKIAGVLKDDGLKVDIPELTALGEDIKSILQGSGKSK